MKINALLLTLIIFNVLVSCSRRPAIPGGQNKDRTSRVERSVIPPPQSDGWSGHSSRLHMENSAVGVKMSPQDIFSKYSDAVFMIFTSTGDEYFQGSGFFINSNGLAVSNYHVFEGTAIGYEIIQLQDGRQYKLKDIVLKDRENDVMMFTIDAGKTRFNYIPLSNRKLRVGDKAYAIGSPRGLKNTFSSGEISQLRDNYIIQISVPIDHGSSGGALINEYGEAIGITSAGLDYSGANLNFAISTEIIKSHL